MHNIATLSTSPAPTQDDILGINVMSASGKQIYETHLIKGFVAPNDGACTPLDEQCRTQGGVQTR